MDEKPQEQPFTSVFTGAFPEILHTLDISLVVTTYQSGHVILVRAESATEVNTHFRVFRGPMGVAFDGARLALGTAGEVWRFRNHPGLAPRLEPPEKHDACFLPRGVHFTGDVQVHEMGYAGGELWLVNTRFSALCTLEPESSFVPRWRPPFVTQLAGDDRCHLNGMAIVDGRVRYVTALGTSDTAGGWREEKAHGGVLVDVESGETVLRGLSMPHSPRAYDGFWLLESGKGTFARADLGAGRVHTVAELPGFTRGLAFAGPYAFVGLSQVRESSVFGGIPLIDRVAERSCGVWVVDLRTGRPAAFLRFEGRVQEIFDVQVLHGIRYPELVEPYSPFAGNAFTLPDESANTVCDFLREAPP